MLTLISPVAYAARSEERTWAVNYASQMDNSVNLLDDTRTSEWDKWIFDNYTYADDGVIHGSDVPESRWTLPIVQSHYQGTTLKLSQNITFPPALLMSGAARFWIRLPVKVSINDTPDTTTFRETDYIYDSLSLFINNSYTGQSFHIRMLHLTNHIPGTELLRHDWMRGRPVLELSLPLYTNIEYEFTVVGEVREGEQAVFYTAYGDIGNDYVMSSSWRYAYYDSFEGELVEEINDTYPIDLGLYFVFREGIPISGELGLQVTIPTGKSIYWLQDINWNLTDGNLTYYMNIPVGPRIYETLNMTLRVQALSDAGYHGQLVAITDTWNTSSNVFRFQANLTGNNTDWLISLTPNDIQSQTVIVGVKDRRVNPINFASQYFTDYSQYHYYSINMLEWRGSNYTDVPRPTRSGEQPDYDAWDILTAKPLTDWVEGFKAATPELNYVATSDPNEIDALNDLIVQQHLDQKRNEMLEQDVTGTVITGAGIETLTARAWRITPAMEMAAHQSAYRVSMVSRLQDQIADTLRDGASTVGQIIEDIPDLVDNLTGVFSEVLEWGAEMIGSIISVVQTLIGLAEVVLSATMIIITLVVWAVLIIVELIFLEVIYLIFTGQHEKLFKSIMGIFKGGGKE